MNFKIGRVRFWSIFTLILFMPVLWKSKLILFGVRTEAKVIDKYWVHHKSHRPSKTLFLIIQYEAGDIIKTMYGPPGEDYEIGQKVKVIYAENDPSDYRILSVYHFYAGLEAGIAGFLLVIWSVLYRTFG